jgi:hypothetical protein
MTLDEALTARRTAVLDRWFQAVAATYPEEAARLLSGVADPFSNPVGGTLRVGLARLFDGLASVSSPAELAAAVDGIVRIRAVQEFAPSAAVGFVYELKGILRDELAGAALTPGEHAALESAVDRMALAAFDVYMQCREKIFTIRVREIRESQLLATRFKA